MGRQRLKIIPDRIFHKLWDSIDKYDGREDYVSALSTDSSLFNYNSYKMTYSEAIYLLNSLYKAKNMTFKELIDAAGVKKSEISHIFCIPIRTVEDWYSGRNRTPSYIKIMVLKQYHMLDLGKYVRLESSIEYIKTQPSIYIKRYSNNDQINITDQVGQMPVNPEVKDDPVKNADYYYDEFISGAEYERYLDKLIAESKNRRNH